MIVLGLLVLLAAGLAVSGITTRDDGGHFLARSACWATTRPAREPPVLLRTRPRRGGHVRASQDGRRAGARGQAATGPPNLHGRWGVAARLCDARRAGSSVADSCCCWYLCAGRPSGRTWWARLAAAWPLP